MSNIPRRDFIELRFERRLELLRGLFARWRGVKAGNSFGLGRNVRIIYPSCVTVKDDVSIADSCYLHCLSSRGVCIGSRTNLDFNVWLHCGNNYYHGYFTIGDDSAVGCNAVLGAGGGIQIGNHVLIGQGVNIHAERHNFDEVDRLISEQGVQYTPVIIEDDVWIGSKATILGGVTIGGGSVVGAGSVVTKSIPPYSVVVGVPARIIRARK